MYAFFSPLDIVPARMSIPREIYDLLPKVYLFDTMPHVNIDVGLLNSPIGSVP